ncbi:ABC transporter ATP-binding protein [Mesorhizobium sp. Cs1299R1N1]|uniref:ABC transporter ATP-binding protein n=1 Tax=Mesorhizobium sp. Cs1299R1N1 TaxID=3015172 RepID=UPI00301D0942
MSTISGPLLEVEYLCVRYPLMGPVMAKLRGVGNRYLDAVLDVSFAIRRGTTLALVGESGSGKSTLGRAIVGLQPIGAGTVRFEGKEPLKRVPSGEKAYHRDVAMMFQDPISSLSPRRTVRALITEPFVVHGLRDKDLEAEARRLLALVGLPPDFAGRYPHQLSGGQARRVGVARAVALSPKLIVADEPTAGLDVSVQGEILNLMSRLQHQLGLTYLIITHNLAVVRHVSDETAVMYMGRFIEHGPTREVFTRPVHPYTAGLLTAQPHPDPNKRRIQAELMGEVPSMAHRPSGCEFHTRCPRAQDICRGTRPDVRFFDPDHSHRCHFPLDIHPVVKARAAARHRIQRSESPELDIVADPGQRAHGKR